MLKLTLNVNSNDKKVKVFVVSVWFAAVFILKIFMNLRCDYKLS